jgi:predicted transcriptional regulator
MEEVKKEVKRGKESLYLYILNLLKQGKNPSKISNELNLTKQNLQYYLSILKQKGNIKKVGYGTWEVQSFNLNTLGLKAKSIRGHAFIWTIKLPQEIKDWETRLIKLNIDYKLVRGQTPRIWLDKKKVWLGHKTITLYEPSSFYGNNAVESRKYATITLLEDLRLLEKLLQFSLGNKYIFNPCREHYALIKNDLAKQVNRNGEKIIVHDEIGEWLWIDASDGIGELETGNHKALINNVGVQKWWNDMKETKFEVTPSWIKEVVSGVAMNQQMFNQNFESHVLAIKTLSSSVQELTNQVKLLQEENRSLRNGKKE